ncbi:MAG: hypothetical protein K1X68_07990, partial [Saprospiraceae bacterium]|nr:hypothetical protein [Saprospiraceae bacterium]
MYHIRHTFLTVLLVLLYLATPDFLHAGIIFDGSPGTNAPPATLGGFTMVNPNPDTRPLFSNESEIAFPSPNCAAISFSLPLNHRRIGAGWATWSHGYPGDVYYSNGLLTITITLPAGTRAFYLYIEGNNFIPANIEASANDGTTSGPIPVVGNSGARYYGFYTSSSACLLTSITITADPNSGGFAVGEFGLYAEPCSDILACKDINVSLDAQCQATITPAMLLAGSSCLCNKIVELSHYNKPISNPVTNALLGKTITGRVIDTETGNSCWSNILIEDKLAPEIVCRTKILDCYRFVHDLPLNYSGFDCSHYTVTATGDRTEHLTCDEEYLKKVYRDIKITDETGNVSECTDTILVKRIQADDIKLPSGVFDYYCDYPDLLDDKGHPNPNYTGYPYFVSEGTGITLYPLDLLISCNLLVTYEDLDLGEINCVHKIMRTWTVREWWCNTEIVRNELQVIIIKDTHPPVITHHPYDFSATTNRNGCYANVTLPAIEAVDNCHNNIRVDVVYPGGILINKNGGIVQLPAGIDTIIYRVYDGCYNLTEYELHVTVADETEPIAICDRRTVVSLNGSGENWVPAEVFDDGSFDECHLHHMEV